MDLFIRTSARASVTALKGDEELVGILSVCPIPAAEKPFEHIIDCVGTLPSSKSECAFQLTGFAHQVGGLLSLLREALEESKLPVKVVDYVNGFRRRLMLAWKMACDNLTKARRRKMRLFDRRARKELERFLEMVGHYSSFCCNFSTFGCPLTNLLKGGRKFLQPYHFKFVTSGASTM